jgi:hypothetical protein
MLNRVAFETRKAAVKNVETEMTLRNQWTKKTIQFQQTRSLNISRQRTRTGSLMDYMRQQEFGSVRKTKGKVGVPIPTTVASGEGEAAKVRKKVVRRKWLRSSIKLVNAKRRLLRPNQVIKGKNPKQSVAIAMSMAERRGGRNRVAFLSGKRKGLYWIKGRKGKMRVSLLHDLSNPSVRIPATPWLLPATVQQAKFMGIWFQKALAFHQGRRGRR